MAVIKAFKGLRPPRDIAHLVASKPYDVLSSEEAKEEAKDNEYSFLHIIKPEIDLPDGTDVYDGSVYEKARENFEKFKQQKILLEDDEEHLYIYMQIMNGRTQLGIVGCSSIDDYFKDVIKKHEYTRPDKENDRIRHMRSIRAHPGPVFLTYPRQEEIDQIVNAYIINNEFEYDFLASDGVQHTFWVIRDKNIVELIESLFRDYVPFTYIADGHHRAASSAKVGKELRENTEYKGDEDFNYFLSVLFPDDQIQIIDYNRVVRDLNRLSKEEFLDKTAAVFNLTPIDYAYKPDNPHEFGMYIDGQWYRLVAKRETYDENDPVAVLDISILSKYLLDPVLGIQDQRTDDKIDFIGGIRGLEELERLVDSGKMAVAFSIYPVTVKQLMDIADSGQVMPPKSTWFEPKLRSGLVVHTF